MSYKIYIGTSGWTYKHWKGIFYPEDCPQSKWLEFYTRHYNAVELNASFYRLPSLQTFINWRERTPDAFLWSVKASRYITHIKRIKDINEPLARFFNSVDLLREKLGPILFQLPPTLIFDEKLLRGFCDWLKSKHLYAIEVRHTSWAQEKAIDILRDNNIALCISDTAGRFPYIEQDTADFIYIRLHGPQKLYASEYSESELLTYAKKIKNWQKDTYIYFDNDFNGYALKNAKRLGEMLGLR